MKKQLADKIYDLNLKMFLRDNFVHGDMHVRTHTHERCFGFRPAQVWTRVMTSEQSCGRPATCCTMRPRISSPSS